MCRYDYTTYIKGVVSIKASYNDNGYHCYRGGVRYDRFDRWEGSYVFTTFKYTTYGTGPNDGAVRTKTVTDNHAIIDRYTYTFEAEFYWVPDGSPYWPVSTSEPI